MICHSYIGLPVGSISTVQQVQWILNGYKFEVYRYSWTKPECHVVAVSQPVPAISPWFVGQLLKDRSSIIFDCKSLANPHVFMVKSILLMTNHGA